MKRFNILLIALIGLLASCSGAQSSDESSPVPGVTPTPTPTTPALASSVAEAIQRSTLPKLDTSNSLAGPDIDSNGIRDDIDSYIAGLPDSAPQKAALRQSAKALSDTLTANLSDSGTVNRLVSEIARSVVCESTQYGNARRGADLEQYIVNTRPRIKAYVDFNKAGARSTGMPDLSKPCN